ncbi:MAG: hypothetical protein LHV68_08190 [Elusimicrobia bacterium]|nr:hypothetical protein [Candidatus Liberimonas magnetica]
MRIFITFLVILFNVHFISADSIIGGQVTKINHPNVNLNDVKPLIIDYEIIWNGNTKEKHRKEYYPMVYRKYNIYENDKIHEEFKDSYLIYHDAFETLDKKGYFLFSQHFTYGGKLKIETLAYYDLIKEKTIELEPTGRFIYFTKDNKYMVTVDLPYEFIEPNDIITLNYYNLLLTSNKPEKVEKLKYTEFKVLDIINPSEQK